jgi:hypothetical protein
MYKEIEKFKEKVKGITLLNVRRKSKHPASDIYYLGHHKCASNWMRKFMYEICQIISYNYIVFGGDSSKNIASRWRHHTCYLYVNSTTEHLESVPSHARGFHLIRDPRDVLVSDYYSRKNTHRVDTPWKRNLRDYLVAHDLEEGLLHMLDHCTYYEQIDGWNLGSRSNILDVRYEDLLVDEIGVFRKILQHLHISIPAEALQDIIESCSFKAMSGGRARGVEDQHSHYRKGMAGDWQLYMPKGGTVYKAFNNRFGRRLHSLGYE